MTSGQSERIPLPADWHADELFHEFLWEKAQCSAQRAGDSAQRGGVTPSQGSAPAWQHTQVRFVGSPGEQATMFFRDPAGNALEFKSFRDQRQLFATE